MSRQVDIHNAFNVGEISPALMGRGDLAAYHNALRLCRNWIIRRAGGLEKRPGTIKVNTAPSTTGNVRKIPFKFSEGEAYALEFTANTMRIMTGDGILLVQPATFSSLSAIGNVTHEIILDNHGLQHGAGPLRFTDDLPTGTVLGADYYADIPQTLTIEAVDHDGLGSIGIAESFQVTGHELYEDMGPYQLVTSQTLPTGVTALTDYYISNPVTDSFELSLTPAGASVTISDNGTGTHTLVPSDSWKRNRLRLRAGQADGPLVVMTAGLGLCTLSPVGEQILEISHVYTDGQIWDFDYAQSGAIMYLVHPDVPIQRLSRWAANVWDFNETLLEDGPYLIEQELVPGVLYPGVQMNPSAATGIITIQATDPAGNYNIFHPSDIGRHFRYDNAAGSLEVGWGTIVGVGATNNFSGPTGQEIERSRDYGGALHVLEWKGNPWLVQGEPFCLTEDFDGLTAGTVYWSSDDSWGSLNRKVYYTYDDAMNDVNEHQWSDIWAPNGILSHTSYLTITAHLLTNLAPCTITTTGTLPTGIQTGTIYFLEEIDANTLTLSLSVGGIPIPITSSGLGAHTLHGGGGDLEDTCTVSVVDQLHVDLDATDHWRLGAFGARAELGYPSAVSLHEQRLMLAGAPGGPQLIDGSQTGLYEYFAPDEPSTLAADLGDHSVTDASAFRYELVSGDINRIVWLASLQTLLAGTLGGIWSIQPTSLNQKLTPTNVNALRASTRGASAVKPVHIGETLVFVSDDRRMLVTAAYELASEGVVPHDPMVIADHFAAEATIVQLAYLPAPLQLVLALRDDGQIMAMTFDTPQEVTAFGRLRFGGSYGGNDWADVETIAVVPPAQAEPDRLWMSLRRTYTNTVRTVEYMGDRFTEETAQADAHFVDGSPTPYSGAAATVFDGFGHLEGATLQIQADGARVADQAVSNGRITLQESATEFRAGIGYQAIGSLPPPELARETGVQLAFRKKSMVNVYLRLLRTLGLKVGPDEDNLQRIEFRSLHGDDIDAAPPLFTGIVDVTQNSGYDREGGLVFASDDPLPAQVLSVGVHIEWHEP